MAITSAPTSSERTQVLYGAKNVIKKELEFFSQTQSRIDTCMDHTRPAFAIQIDSIRQSFLEAKNKGARLRYLTEITNDNISYCKELISIVNELRHLDGIKGNFMISEKEYLAPAVSHKEKEISPLIIYSSVQEIVEHQKYVFDTLWNKSGSAQKRIREIEEGTTTIHYETKIIQDSDEVVREIRRLTADSNELRTCLTSGGLQYSYDHFFEVKKKLLQKQREGAHKGIRYITNIDKDNSELAKVFLDAGIQIRHIKNLPPMSFGVSDKEIAATIEKMEGGRMVQSLLLSNEPAYIHHFNSVFDELWKNGINAEDRLRDIELGADLTNVEIIPMSSRAKVLYLNLVKEAEKEIIILFPTTNAFLRQNTIGAVPLAKEVSQRRNVSVRVLMPKHESTEQLVQKFTDKEEEGHINLNNIDVRYIEQTILDTHVTILVVDRKASLVMEIRDDSKTTFDEAIGLSIYSNSRPGVLSYVSIFENLWKQTELYEQLKQHDKMQKEFINVAAHELKTPIQPILGFDRGTSFSDE